jgi:glycosyltransferase involved in cell wall biosynthesis
MDLVTIGITCFNASKTIERAINSAINQDWTNKEIIIVDDNSEDDSAEIIKKFDLTKYSIKFYKHKINKGPAGSRNTIINKALGKYLVFFDDDDFSEVNRMTSQYHTIKKYEKKLNTKKILCFASGKRIYPTGYNFKIRAIGSLNNKALFGKLIPDYLLLFKTNKKFFYGAGIPSCAIMANLSIFKSLNGYDEQFRRIEDADFAIRFALDGGYFVGSKKELFIQYSTRGNDKSNSMNLVAEKLIVKKHKSYLDEMNLFFHAYNWPILRFYHFEKTYFKFIILLLKLFARNPILTLVHLLKTGPKRLRHEIKMNKNNK